MAGYSGTPLAKKLGVKPDTKLLLVNAPNGFVDELEGMPAGATVTTRMHDAVACAVVFVTRQAEMKAQFARLLPRLAPNGGLWIAWPKQAAKLPTDLNENIVRNYGLTTGLVDNKVCAVNQVWSGLRFVIRLKDRP